MISILSMLLFLVPVVRPGVEEEIRRLEQQLTDALVRFDTRVIESLWADDLVFIGTNGVASSKEQRLSGMKAAPAPTQAIVSDATNDEVSVRVYGQTAVVTLLSTWNTRGPNRESKDRYMTTHVWVKQSGKWRLVSAHVGVVR